LIVISISFNILGVNYAKQSEDDSYETSIKSEILLKAFDKRLAFYQETGNTIKKKLNEYKFQNSIDELSKKFNTESKSNTEHLHCPLLDNSTSFRKIFVLFNFIILGPKPTNSWD
jgi:hypothetical protein